MWVFIVSVASPPCYVGFLVFSIYSDRPLRRWWFASAWAIPYWTVAGDIEYAIHSRESESDFWQNGSCKLSRWFGAVRISKDIPSPGKFLINYKKSPLCTVHNLIPRQSCSRLAIIVDSRVCERYCLSKQPKHRVLPRLHVHSCDTPRRSTIIKRDALSLSFPPDHPSSTTTSPQPPPLSNSPFTHSYHQWHPHPKQRSPPPLPAR